MSTDRYIKNESKIVAKRSLFPLRRRTLLSYLHGFFQPVGSPIEILPGDTIKAKLSCFTRMSTPIVPFMDNIRQEVDAFFVPKRIIWNKTKQFYGEAPSFGVATPVVEPYVLPNSSSFKAIQLGQLITNELKCESFGAAFGLIYDDSTGSAVDFRINLNPIRAYMVVWNEFFRDENYQDPFTFNKDATGAQNILATYAGANILSTSLLPRVNKDRDVVSSILPYQIKGSPVRLSIGGSAPVLAAASNHDMGAYISLGSSFAGNPDNIQGNLQVKAGTVQSETGSLSDSLYKVDRSNLVADLSQATAVSVSDLIYAFAYQDFLARAAHFGTRYKEYIYGMFGTIIADATEDIPEYLGRLKFNINVNQVVQTTGFQASASTELGALGAYSNSGNSGELFNKSFTEPGYIVLVSYTKHQRTYSSGIDRVFLKTELLDYYQPPFANIADVPFMSGTLWTERGAETSLGFQEPFWDYKGLLDRTYGMMNPKVDSLGEIWTLAEKWIAKPTIGSMFMYEDRAAIARVLATGANGPDYIMDFQLDMVAARVMPISSRTGLKVM